MSFPFVEVTLQKLRHGSCRAFASSVEGKKCETTSYAGNACSNGGNNLSTANPDRVEAKNDGDIELLLSVCNNSCCLFIRFAIKDFFVCNIDCVACCFVIYPALTDGHRMLQYVVILPGQLLDSDFKDSDICNIFTSMLRFTK